MTFNKYINKIFYIIFILLCAPNFYAFGNFTHEQLTEIACHRVKMLEQFTKEQQKIVLSHLLLSCNIPDAQETDWFMWGHFYNFNTECSSLIKDSALSRMNLHFQKAKSLWYNSDRFSSIDELGKSIHYMQDICCIAHLWGRMFNVFNLDKHRKYENAMDVVASSYSYIILQSSTQFNFRDNANMPIVGVANLYALQVISRYQNNLPNPSFWDFFDVTIGIRKRMIGVDKLREKAKKIVPFEDFELAYQATCELIYLFFQEVGISL